MTDSEGRVFFRNLRAGAHGFRIDDGSGGGFVLERGGGNRAYASISMGGAETPFEEFELAAGETLAITLVQGVSSSLSGVVSEDGIPLEKAELRLVADGDPPMPGMGGGPTARSDAAGNYLFENVEPGTYELVVSHPSRALAYRQEVELRAGAEQLDLDLDVTVVEGRVTDEEGLPLAGARVRAEQVRSGPQRRVAFVMVTQDDDGGADLVVGGSDAAEPVTTDEGGRYTLRGVPSGMNVRVRAEAGRPRAGRGRDLRAGAQREARRRRRRVAPRRHDRGGGVPGGRQPRAADAHPPG